jgi:hypothetical protein
LDSRNFRKQNHGNCSLLSETERLTAS